MKQMIRIASINRTYANYGNHVQQALDYTLTGKIRKHDAIPFDKGSDIPELKMSVKSNGFTLASSRINYGDTFEAKVNDYMSRTHSEQFAYVTLDGIAYIMDKATFEKFVRTFCYLDRESKRNGGGLKVKCLKESKKMLQWLERA